MATQALRIIALGFPLYAFGMVMSQSFNGPGDTWTPTWINLFVFWLFEIPLAYVLANHTALSYRGGFVAVTVAYCAGPRQRMAIPSRQVEDEAGLRMAGGRKLARGVRLDGAAFESDPIASTMPSCPRSCFAAGPVRQIAGPPRPRCRSRNGTSWFRCRRRSRQDSHQSGHSTR